MERSQTVDRALALIDTLEVTPGLTLAELSASLGIHKTIIRRLVASLQAKDYIRRTSDGRHRLGLRLIALGRTVSDALELRQMAMPHMLTLSESVGETILLTALDHDEAVCLEQVDLGRQVLRVAARLGIRLPVYRGTSSKVLLAFQPAEMIERIVAPLPDSEVLRKQLMEFRSHGYAQTAEELDEGIGGIGAPIRDHHGAVIAGLTIVGPISRVNATRAPDLAQAVISAANEVSRAMGYRDATAKGDSR